MLKTQQRHAQKDKASATRFPRGIAAYLHMHKQKTTGLVASELNIKHDASLRVFADNAAVLVVNASHCRLTQSQTPSHTSSNKRDTRSALSGFSSPALATSVTA